MFTESLLENPRAAQRAWPTLASYCMEAIILALLVLIPLLGSVGLPSIRSITTVLPLGLPNEPRAATPHSRPSTIPPVNPQSLAIRFPLPIPHPIGLAAEDNNAPIDSLPTSPGFGLPIGTSGSFTIPDAGNYVPPTPAPPSPPSRPTRLVISHMEPGMLIHQVRPIYPEAARITHTQGSVQLAAVIAQDGAIKDVRVLSGPALLVKAAAEAVLQWRYRPYILNGQPVEVETQITVNFTLGGQ